MPISFQPLLIFLQLSKRFIAYCQRQKWKERKTKRCQYYPWNPDNHKRASNLGGSVPDLWIKSTFHILNYYRRVLSFYVGDITASVICERQLFQCCFRGRKRG